MCYTKPHGPASKDTVARWMKNDLTEAGMTDFAAHSFRGADASAMVTSGVALDDVLQKAGWTNAATFRTFYYRETCNENRKVKKTRSKS